MPTLRSDFWLCNVMLRAASLRAGNYGDFNQIEFLDITR
jgi:hypothetical protein